MYVLFFFFFPTFSFNLCQGLLGGLDDLWVLPNMVIIIFIPSFKLLSFLGNKIFQVQGQFISLSFFMLCFLSNSLSRHLLCWLVNLIKINIDFSSRKLNFGCVFQSLSETLGKTEQSSCIQPKMEETDLPFKTVTQTIMNFLKSALQIHHYRYQEIFTMFYKRNQNHQQGRILFCHFFLFHLSKSFVLIKRLSEIGVKKFC